MKKKLALLLTACMTASMIAGCGQSAQTQAPAAESDAPAQETDAQDAADEQAQGSAAAEELPDVPVTIRFATQSMDRETSVRYSVLEQFQKDYPNVTLEIEESPGNDLITKINTDVMGDNTPDMFTFWRPESKWNVDKYIEKGAIADLTD